MRKVSPLIGLTLIALASTARAQQATPVTPAAQPAPVVATVGVEGPQAAPPRRRFQVGLSFLPMAMGTITASAAGIESKDDSAFAMGLCLQAGFEVIPGLSVGIAPQIIYKGKPKESSAGSDQELDLMARIAYSYVMPKVASVYVELLPGYSTIYPSVTDTSKGLVVAFGVGGTIDITDRTFVNIGVGYQKGFQKLNASAEYKTDYVRVALGGGMRF